MSSATCRAKFRVFIVDDHDLVLFGLSQLVNNESDLMVCGEAGSEEEALSVIGPTKPDVALVDLSLQKGSGLSLIRKLHWHCPKLPILVVTMHEELAYAARSLRAGAKGYLVKTEAKDKVLVAIRCLLAGQSYLSEGMQARMARLPADGRLAAALSPAEKLSDRELEVFELLGHGMATKQVAAKLDVSVSTVDWYRAEIKRKMGLGSGTELLQQAAKWVAEEKRPPAP